MPKITASRGREIVQGNAESVVYLDLDTAENDGGVNELVGLIVLVELAATVGMALSAFASGMDRVNKFLEPLADKPR